MVYVASVWISLHITFGAEEVTTVLFDSYSTLVDVGCSGDSARRVSFGSRAGVETWAGALTRGHVCQQPHRRLSAFYEMNRDALQYVLDVHYADISETDCDEILAIYHELGVFDDVREGIERLRDRGYERYVISNDNPEMLELKVEHADIGGILEDTISGDEIQTFKSA